ncbi:MAG: hypothetical protein CMN74_06225 [Sphingorhabdus sp.]|nr:hypothetical protein [Sphingorhabdus sp.]|tara:strand:- start:1125 stop:1361 length:237 start_codon:yes stop_codon:yes gene_type:complete
MRAAASGLLLLSLLAACKEKEPDFDTQYDNTAKEIEARARKLDAKMNEQMQVMDRELEVRGMTTPPTTQTPAAVTEHN